MDGRKDILNDYTLKHVIKKVLTFTNKVTEVSFIHWPFLSLDSDWLHIDYSFFTSKKREHNTDGISI